jgi:hypothetical protein
MASTCLGTSSWQKCPEPTVLPYRIWGNISWKRPMSERGCSPSLGLYRYAYLRRSVSSEIDQLSLLGMALRWFIKSSRSENSPRGKPSIISISSPGAPLSSAVERSVSLLAG